MPRQEKIMDCFTRARYAAWPGDVDHCRELLIDIKRQSRKLGEQKHLGTFGLILRAADQLSGRLNAQRRNGEYAQKTTINEKQLLTSKHLRAVVHRIGEFEFEVR